MPRKPRVPDVLELTEDARRLVAIRLSRMRNMTMEEIDAEDDRNAKKLKALVDSIGVLASTEARIQRELRADAKAMNDKDLAKALREDDDDDGEGV